MRPIKKSTVMFLAVAVAVAGAAFTAACSKKASGTKVQVIEFSEFQ